MIWIWLVLLAVVYVVVAIIVGKMCAINSRWEKTVDDVDSGPVVHAAGSGRTGDFDLAAVDGVEGVNRERG